MVSTGQIDDAMTRAASAMIGGYETCQLAWPAQPLNTTIRQYANYDPATVKAVQDNWLKLADFGKDFASFFALLVDGRAGHLDMASMKREG